MSLIDFVLIHGTTQSPRSWGKLIKELSLIGHRSVAIDLTWAVDQSLAGLVEEVARQVPDDFNAPVFVAHSGTGPLLAHVAQHLPVSHLVWLAALIPDGRRSLQDEISENPELMFNPEWIGTDPTEDDLLASYFLFHDADLQTLRWALDTMRLSAPAALYSGVVAPPFETPSTYVLGTMDRVLKPQWSLEAARARLHARIIELPAGHCPHVSQPRLLARVLSEVHHQDYLK